MKKIIFFTILSLTVLSASRVFAGDDEKGVKFFKGTDRIPRSAKNRPSVFCGFSTVLVPVRVEC